MQHPNRAGPGDLDDDPHQHELRNALAAARMQLDLLRRRLLRDHHAPDDLDEKLASVRASLNRAIVLAEARDHPRE